MFSKWTLRFYSQNVKFLLLLSKLKVFITNNWFEISCVAYFFHYMSIDEVDFVRVKVAGVDSRATNKK